MVFFPTPLNLRQNGRGQAGGVPHRRQYTSASVKEEGARARGQKEKQGEALKTAVAVAWGHINAEIYWWNVLRLKIHA